MKVITNPDRRRKSNIASVKEVPVAKPDKSTLKLEQSLLNSLNRIRKLEKDVRDLIEAEKSNGKALKQLSRPIAIPDNSGAIGKVLVVLIDAIKGLMTRKPVAPVINMPEIKLEPIVVDRPYNGWYFNVNRNQQGLIASVDATPKDRSN
jgi:hypothetical protein